MGGAGIGLTQGQAAHLASAGLNFVGLPFKLKQLISHLFI